MNQLYACVCSPSFGQCYVDTLEEALMLNAVRVIKREQADMLIFFVSPDRDAAERVRDYIKHLNEWR